MRLDGRPATGKTSGAQRIGCAWGELRVAIPPPGAAMVWPVPLHGTPGSLVRLTRPAKSVRGMQGKLGRQP